MTSKNTNDPLEGFTGFDAVEDMDEFGDRLDMDDDLGDDLDIDLDGDEDQENLIDIQAAVEAGVREGMKPALTPEAAKSAREAKARQSVAKELGGSHHAYDDPGDLSMSRLNTSVDAESRRSAIDAVSDAMAEQGGKGLGSDMHGPQDDEALRDDMEGAWGE